MHIETNDDDFYDHVRSGDAAAKDPKSKFNRRRPGDPGVKLEQLMRFFDPKLARKMDDSTEVGHLTLLSTDPTGLLLRVPIAVQRACL